MTSPRENVHPALARLLLRPAVVKYAYYVHDFVCKLSATISSFPKQHPNIFLSSIAVYRIRYIVQFEYKRRDYNIQAYQSYYRLPLPLYSELTSKADAHHPLPPCSELASDVNAHSEMTSDVDAD